MLISKSLRTTSLLYLFFFFYTPAYATVLPIQLSERVKGTDQVVIAKVIAAEANWDANRENIYTTYTMEAVAYLKKASTVTTFQIILPGGEVDGELEVVSPNIQLEIGQEYMVFAENAPSALLKSLGKGKAAKTPQYRPYSHVQGIMPYLDDFYWDYTESIPSDEEEMINKIQKVTKMEALTPSGKKYNPRIKNIDKDNDGVCSQFDCDDEDPNYPKPVGAPCDDGNVRTLNDQIQSDGCTCAGNAGQPINCEAITVAVSGGIVRIDNLLAQREKIEIVGSETNGQSSLICDGDCDETQYIEGLNVGKKVLRIWMFGESNTSCYQEIIVNITELGCLDSDMDQLCNLKDCAPNDANLPATPGTPCDDGNPNTVGDLYLVDGCTCAGFPICPTDVITENRTMAVTIKNGKGEINPTFITGTTNPDNDLVIEGSGFGNVAGTVQFPNSDSGGRTLIAIDHISDIVEWSDTRIRVKIPSKTGTGTFLVKNASNTTVGTGPIIIRFAINSLHSAFRSFPSKTRQNVKFTDRDGQGGLTLQLNSPSGFALSNAVAPLKRAMDTWICATGVNWKIDNSGTTTGFANDGICVASFEPTLPIGILAITTSRYRASGNSSCSLENTVWYLKEFDMQFVDGNSISGGDWNFAEWPPAASRYDFESVALHEFGHAHGLGHVIDDDEIMHYAVQAGIAKRTISNHAYEGGQYKIQQALQPNCIAVHQPMTLLNPACATPPPAPSTSARVKVMLEGYYDTSTKELATVLLRNNLIPSTPPVTNRQAATVASFPSSAVDWLILELRDENDIEKIVAQKPVLVNKNGNLMEVAGDELITFDSVPDDNYYLAIFHKSHLPIISRTAQPLSNNPTLYDFSSSATTTLGTDQQKVIDGAYFMISGDFDGNGIINSLDFNFWKQVGAAINSYSPADADGNGIINNQDFNLWKANGSKVSILRRN